MDNNLIELFRRRIRNFITDLKVIQDKHFRQSKMTPDILGDVEQVHLQFDFLREEKNGNFENPQLVFGNLIEQPFFAECSEIIINIRLQAESALDDSKEGKDSQWFDVRIMEAINRLSEISEELHDKEPAKPVESGTQSNNGKTKTKRRVRKWPPEVVGEFEKLSKSGTPDKEIQSKLKEKFGLKFTEDALRRKRSDLKKT